MKILIIFGTRPEAIKFAPIIEEIKKYNELSCITCITGQHKEMLRQVIDLFKIKIDFDLNVMEKNNDLFEITSKILLGLKKVIETVNPNLILVQGDTSTTFSATLAAFYKKIPVGHVEAGLRTYNKYAPWPEEINRKITSSIADLHFAPSELEVNNLKKEGIKSNIFKTGNTVIDALFSVIKIIEKDKKILSSLSSKFKFLNKEKPIVLLTSHRRENHGKNIRNICEAVLELVNKYKEVNFVIPVHMNPNIKNTVEDYLTNIKNINLIKPLNYLEFIYIMKKSYLILTDSGGVQEEAPSLGIPVLVLRDTSERMAGIKIGTSKIVGTDKNEIFKATSELLVDKKKYDEMSKKNNPYGDGFASKRIIEAILSFKYEQI